MNIDEKIQEQYKTATSYPDLVLKLIAIGVQSYTVDVATRIILYRFSDGENVIHNNSNEPVLVETAFDKELTVKAIRDNQQKKTDYPGFMKDIANAGVRFYEATLIGKNKRVTYIGIGDRYEETIPL